MPQHPTDTSIIGLTTYHCVLMFVFPSRLGSFKNRDYFYLSLSSTQQSHHSENGYVMRDRENVMEKPIPKRDHELRGKSRKGIFKILVAVPQAVSLCSPTPGAPFSLHSMGKCSPSTVNMEAWIVQYNSPDYRQPQSHVLSKGKKCPNELCFSNRHSSICHGCTLELIFKVCTLKVTPT